MKEAKPSGDEDWELSQIKQQPSRLNAKHIGGPMRLFMARNGIVQMQAAQELSAAWSSAAGPQLASVTRPGNISRGVLQIFSHNSTALHELHLRRRQILTALQQALPHAKIKDLRGRVDSIS